MVWFKDRLCVPDINSICELILKEAHETAYSIHPRSEKMYQDLKKIFWWYGMKRANYYNGSRLRPKDGDNARPQQIREALHMQTTAAEG